MALDGESFQIITDTVIGRTKEDYQKFGTEATGYIGKHIVGEGEDTHLTTKVLIDLLKPHIILCAGKRGSGKSYSIAVILEEFCSLEDQFRNKLAFIVLDPMGIYWSMKFPNMQQKRLVESWDLKPKGFENVKVYVPGGLKEEYEQAEIPVDFVLSISPKEFLPEDWTLVFNLERMSEESVAIERIVSGLINTGANFSIEDIVKKIEEDKYASTHAKNILLNLFDMVKSWGIFSEKGMKITDIIKPGQVSVLDLSRVKGEEWVLRNLIAAWISREIYRERLLARKEEEIAKLEGIQTTKSFPMVWIILEEAHNFIPSDRKTVSTEPILTLAKQGREPGITVVCITQMPNKIHQDFLSQADIVISFRLTSEDDLRALHAVHQTYMQEELRKIINRLPRWPGACVIIDDTLEMVFVANIRPRVSWHAGGTPTIT